MIKKLIRIFLSATIILSLVGCSSLSKEDKIAYDLVKTAASKFKNPSSVRISTGVVYNEGTSGLFDISAENSYGARTIATYWIGDSGNSIHNLNDGCDSFEHAKVTAAFDLLSLSLMNGNASEINVEKVNAKLEKDLKNVY